jgi:hypothetical protein
MWRLREYAPVKCLKLTSNLTIRFIFLKYKNSSGGFVQKKRGINQPARITTDCAPAGTAPKARFLDKQVPWKQTLGDFILHTRKLLVIWVLIIRTYT